MFREKGVRLDPGNFMTQGCSQNCQRVTLIYFIDYFQIVIGRIHVSSRILKAALRLAAPVRTGNRTATKWNHGAPAFPGYRRPPVRATFPANGLPPTAGALVARDGSRARMRFCVRLVSLPVRQDQAQCRTPRLRLLKIGSVFTRDTHSPAVRLSSARSGPGAVPKFRRDLLAPRIRPARPPVERGPRAVRRGRRRSGPRAVRATRRRSSTAPRRSASPRRRSAAPGTPPRSRGGPAGRPRVRRAARPPR